MEVNKLDEDELYYECLIRGVSGVKDRNEMQTILRGLLKVNPGNDVFCVNLDSPSEIKECIKKIQELKLCIDSIEGDRFGETYRKADTKLSHLLGRIDRISTRDENLRKKRSTLLKTILYLMKEMEVKVNAYRYNELAAPFQHSGDLVEIRQSMLCNSSIETSNNDDCGQEIFTHQGVALKNLRPDRSSDSLPTGTLTIVQYKTGKWVEWKQTEVVFESDNTDAEWNLVDTVRRRTCSTSSALDGTQCQPTVRICMSQLRSYKVKRHGRQISLMCPNGLHYSFLFQCGSGESFINALRAILNTRKHHHIKNLYLVIDERDESKSLKKSFNELNLFPDQGQTYAWNFVRNLQNRPYETTMQTFSKLTDIFLYRPPENRPLDQDVVELLNESRQQDNTVSTVEVEGYAIVDELPSILPPIKVSPRGQPLTEAQWITFLDENGKVKNLDIIKSIIFKGGIDSGIRYEVWKYLLGYFPWNYSKEELEELCNVKREKYLTMKTQWKTLSRGQEERFTAFRDRKSLIEKDVCRTDRTLVFYSGEDNSKLQTLYAILMTYVMYNFDLGYVQGMSDLLSPILCLMDEEVTAFWCLVGFMYKVEKNFDCDQVGMKNQLSDIFELLRVVSPTLASYLDKHESANMFFCFRWLLVWFKREFTHPDIMTLWEVLWTGLPCPNFHLIICVAILEMHKEQLMKPGTSFTDILKYVNELSYKIDVNEVLLAAETIYEQLKAVNEKLPLAIRRMYGFMPADDDSENSEDDFIHHEQSSEVKKTSSGSLQKLSAVPGHIEPFTTSSGSRTSGNGGGDGVKEDSGEHPAKRTTDDTEHEYTGEIGFESVERSMGLNYY